MTDEGAAPTGTRVPGADSGKLVSWQRAWWHLLWLFFLLIPLLYDREPNNWVATGVAALVFLAIFYYGFRKTGPSLWLSRLAMFGLGVGLFPFNSFAHTLFIFAGMPALCGTRIESLLIGGVTLVASFAYFALHDLNAVYYAIVSIIVLGMQIGLLLNRLESSEQALHGKDRQIAHLAKVTERDRIARDLHDLLGHTLSMIALKSDLAHRLVAQDPARAAEEMRAVAAAAREALSEVRQTIVGLRQISLEEALTATTGMLRVAGVTTAHSIAPAPGLAPAVEQALAQALIEAGTNIVRHAGAQRATVRLEHDLARLSLCIEDDGRGGPITPGNGIQGMRERLTAVGAELLFTSLPQGTRLTITMPLGRGP